MMAENIRTRRKGVLVKNSRLFTMASNKAKDLKAAEIESIDTIEFKFAKSLDDKDNAARAASRI